MWNPNNRGMRLTNYGKTESDSNDFTRSFVAAQAKMNYTEIEPSIQYIIILKMSAIHRN